MLFRSGSATDQANSAFRQRQEAEKVVTEELKKSDELTKGGSAGEMGARMIGSVAIDATKDELGDRAKALGPVGGFVAKQAINKAAEEGQSAVTGRELPSIVDRGAGVLKNGAEKVGDEIKKTEIILGGTSEENKKAGENIAGGLQTTVSIVADTSAEVVNRSQDGELDYNDKVRILGKPVEDLWKATAGTAAEKMSGSKGVGTAVGNAPEKLFDAAESYARAKNAEIKADQAGQNIGEIANVNAKEIADREAQSKFDKFDALVAGKSEVPQKPDSSPGQDQKSAADEEIPGANDEASDDVSSANEDAKEGVDDPTTSDGDNSSGDLSKEGSEEKPAANQDESSEG